MKRHAHRRGHVRAHLLIWTAALALLAAAGLAAWLRAPRAPGLLELPAAAIVADALALVEADPSISAADTRRLLRAAAVAVEEGSVRTAEAHYLLAYQYLRESDPTGAEIQFKRASALRPDWSRPYVGLGIVLGGGATGREDEAVAFLQRAIALDPEWSRPHNRLAVVQRIQGNYAAAEAAALRALELDPGDIANHNNYANLLQVVGRYEESEAHFRRAIALDDAHPKPYYNLACLYSLWDRPDDALRYLERAIAMAGFLRDAARTDPDFEPLYEHPEFLRLTTGPAAALPER